MSNVWHVPTTLARVTWDVPLKIGMVGVMVLENGILFWDESVPSLDPPTLPRNRVFYVIKYAYGFDVMWHVIGQLWRLIMTYGHALIVTLQTVKALKTTCQSVMGDASYRCVPALPYITMGVYAVLGCVNVPKVKKCMQTKVQPII